MGVGSKYKDRHDVQASSRAPQREHHGRAAAAEPSALACARRGLASSTSARTTWQRCSARRSQRAVSVTADINNVPIFVLEDGAKLDLLRKWNVAASQIATDAKGCAESFRNANIVLIPNNDDSGYQYIDKVGSALTGIAKSIRVLVLPGLDKGHDILDWAGAGGTAE